MDTGDEHSVIPAERLIAILKYRGMDSEALLVAQQRNIKALIEASDVVARGMEEIASRQADMVRDAVGRASDAMPDLAKRRSLEDMTRTQLDYARASMESALTNFQQITELVWKCNRDTYELLNRSVLDSLQSFLKAMPGQGQSKSAGHGEGAAPLLVKPKKK